MSTKRGHRDHRFGGDWTEQKLRVLAGYLTGYTTALKKTPFRRAFIDAFAGSGYRRGADSNQGATDRSPLFPDLAAEDPQALLEGSARIALKTEPGFDRYIFIERHPERCASLELLKTEFPGAAAKIVVRRGDANDEIQKLCKKDWSASRAVLFLDPYGMQVEWETIEAASRTKAIDLWILFPLGIGVNRLLKRSGEIPESWRRRLNTLLGTEDWYDEFYQIIERPTLFGDADEQIVKASMEAIGRYFNNRLRSVFPGVAEQPGVLRNSTNSPLYLLCFAVGNARGKDIALRIADHLLKEVR